MVPDAALGGGRRVIGARQAAKAVRRGAVLRVYIAQDAEDQVIRPLSELCGKHAVPVRPVRTMRELGEAFGIAVGAAAAAVLKEP